MRSRRLCGLSFDLSLRLLEPWAPAVTLRTVIEAWYSVC